jgi:methyl coenzyme M reductase alpha subunit
MSYAIFEGEDLHMAMWIPVPHAIESYAPGISTAGPLSGFNQYDEYWTLVEAVFGCGHAADADADAASTVTTACSKSRRWEMTQARQENNRGIEEFGTTRS